MIVATFETGCKSTQQTTCSVDSYYRLNIHESPATGASMANLENVSTGDLRQILAEVDDADAAQRLMAAITYKKIDSRGGARYRIHLL